MPGPRGQARNFFWGLAKHRACPPRAIMKPGNGVGGLGVSEEEKRGSTGQQGDPHRQAPSAPSFRSRIPVLKNKQVFALHLF